MEESPKNVVRRLAIIGAGPKGAAIAAKAAALRAAKHPRPVPHIDLYDPVRVGAAWRGSIGYTDGVQPLCTRAERDLGFPYDTLTYGPRVAQAMVADFSWQSFAIDSSLYHDWVIEGRHPPRHVDFASYLEYAVKKAERQGAVSLIPNTVSAVDFDSKKGMWRIESLNSLGVTTSDDYDGVVITGSGPPRRALNGANGRVFDGRTFWQPASRPRMQQLLFADPYPSVVIIGAGGTGAAIAYSFVRRGIKTLPITIVGPEATLFARHEGPFEDRLFTDEILWGVLELHVREAFLARTTAGVVWDSVLRNLVSDNIMYVSYSARRYRAVGPGPGGPGQPLELQLELDAPPAPAPATVVAGPPPPPIATQPGTVFIDARGFDRWGFADDFFAASQLHAFFAAPGRRKIEATIARDLSLCGTLASGASFPAGLHVPGLGALQGPAATNLMGLGWLADRVLSRYC